MSGLPHARTFSELEVYRRASKVAQQIFELTKAFPREETFALTDQLRRSSRSIGAQISEAWAKRRYRRSFVSKLTDAIAEELETQHWVQVARNCGYLAEQQSTGLIAALDEIGSMLHSMIEKAHLFCDRQPVRR